MGLFSWLNGKSHDDFENEVREHVVTLAEAAQLEAERRYHDRLDRAVKERDELARRVEELEAELREAKAKVARMEELEAELRDAKAEVAHAQARNSASPGDLAIGASLQQGLDAVRPSESKNAAGSAPAKSQPPAPMVTTSAAKTPKRPPAKARAAKQRRPERKVSPVRLPEVLPLDDIAAASSSWDDFLARIGNELAACDVEYVCVTKSAHSIERGITPLRVAFTYGLLRAGELPFVDESQRRRLKRLLELDRTQFDEWYGYDWNRVSREGECASDQARWLTQIWEVERFFKDGNLDEYDFDYAWSKATGAKSLAELYACHMNCPLDQAQAAVKEYALKKAGALAQQYPGWDAEVREGKTVMALRLPQNERADIWSHMQHPFFSKHTRNGDKAASAASAFLEFFDRNIRSPFFIAYGFRDRIEYGNRLGSVKEFATETEDEFRIVRSESYSQHDGGGGDRETTVFSFAPTTRRPASLQKPLPEEGWKIPPCKGYWDEGDVRYLVKPFGLEGVFSYTVKNESWD